MQRDDALKILIRRYLWTVPKCTANGCCNEEEDDCLLTPHAVSRCTIHNHSYHRAMEGGDVPRWSVWGRLPAWWSGTQDMVLWVTEGTGTVQYISCLHLIALQPGYSADKSASMFSPFKFWSPLSNKMRVYLTSKTCHATNQCPKSKSEWRNSKAENDVVA